MSPEIQIYYSDNESLIEKFSDSCVFAHCTFIVTSVNMHTKTLFYIILLSIMLVKKSVVNCQNQTLLMHQPHAYNLLLSYFTHSVKVWRSDNMVDTLFLLLQKLHVKFKICISRYKTIQNHLQSLPRMSHSTVCVKDIHSYIIRSLYSIYFREILSFC